MNYTIGIMLGIGIGVTSFIIYELGKIVFNKIMRHYLKGKS